MSTTPPAPKSDDVAKAGGAPVREGPAFLPEEDDPPERGGTPDSHGGRGEDWRGGERGSQGA